MLEWMFNTRATSRRRRWMKGEKRKKKRKQGRRREGRDGVGDRDGGERSEPSGREQRRSSGQGIPPPRPAHLSHTRMGRGEAWKKEIYKSNTSNWKQKKKRKEKERGCNKSPNIDGLGVSRLAGHLRPFPFSSLYVFFFLLLFLFYLLVFSFSQSFGFPDRSISNPFRLSVFPFFPSFTCAWLSREAGSEM